MNFIREVENEMHHNDTDNGGSGSGGNRMENGGKIQPPLFDPASKGGDFFDV